MLKTIDGLARGLVASSFVNMHRFLFCILSVVQFQTTPPLFWMGIGAGFLTLMCMLKYCYELGVKYMTIYAFNIDNFRRSPEEVQYLMDLMLEKIEGLLKQETVINEYGEGIHFVGNLKLLDEPVRVAAEKVMQVTAKNTKSSLLICVAYTSTDEIVHAVQASCQEKWNEIQELDHVINLVDIERHTYMGLAPDPDVLIRTSGASHISNILFW
ncbi:hypothetical protein R3W88_006150 [Solanum pinnatisectum]|uniref:Alkyl transferase n=1 Tax=Solanum pinnatisectum TaxID=50273 RepID=A0AAV9KE52_9SOLN|nr:hypothetical protein R3W88_006150 [Solanum pinnatisectum]